MRWFPLFAILATSSATPALCGTVTVSPNGPLATIQAGVDAAVAGDVVVVKAGTYSGNVIVPVGKDGLVLKAAGNVVLDARGPAGAAIGVAIDLNSANVVVRGFVVRNAATTGGSFGDGIRVDADGCRIEKCTVTACERTGVFVNASNVAVTSSKLSRNDFGLDTGTSLTGLVVTKTDFDFNEDRAANLKADTSATFQKCRFRGGVSAIRGVLPAANDGTRVEKCSFEGVLGNGVLLKGADLVVANCVMKRGGGGMFLEGTNGSIRANRIDGVASNSAAMFIRNATDFLVEDNVFVQVNGAAIELDDSASNCTLRDNVVKQSVASNNRDAYVIDGAGHVLQNNRVVDAAGDGFGIVGDGIALSGGSAVRCGRDGIDIDAAAAGTTLTAFTARQCRAEGLDNSGAATVVNGGVFLQNRIDVSNDGTITLNGVTFVTGGQNVTPEID